jgi:hypothetical protein
MIFYCPDCSTGLVQTGRVQCFYCPRCKCIYNVEVKINLTRIAGGSISDADLRKLELTEHNTSDIAVEHVVSDIGFDGPVSSR